MPRLMRICIIPAIAGFLCSCENGGSKSNHDLAPIGSKTLAMYGRVNEWAFCSGAPLETVLDTMRKEAEALAANGWDGGQIELWSWVRYSGIGSAAGMQRIREVFPEMVRVYRKLGLWLVVSGANDNQGLGKWGDPGIPLSKDAGFTDECLALVLAQGPENMIVQPVCETQTSAGRDMERKWAAALKPAGFFLLDNHGSRPTRQQAWADAAVWHPCSLDLSGIAQTLWVNNDCGLAIMAMSGGGMRDPANPSAVAKYLADGIARGFPAIMVYAWGHADLDIQAIQAIRGVQR